MTVNERLTVLFLQLFLEDMEKILESLQKVDIIKHVLDEQ